MDYDFWNPLSILRKSELEGWSLFLGPWRAIGFTCPKFKIDIYVCEIRYHRYPSHEGPQPTYNRLPLRVQQEGGRDLPHPSCRRPAKPFQRCKMLLLTTHTFQFSIASNLKLICVCVRRGITGITSTCDTFFPWPYWFFNVCVWEKVSQVSHPHVIPFFSGRFDFWMCVCEKRYHRYHIHMIFMPININLNLNKPKLDNFIHKRQITDKKKYLIKGILEYEQWHSVFSSSTVETASNAFNPTFFKILQEQKN